MSVFNKHFDFDGTSFNCCAIVTPDNKVYWKLSNFSDLLGYFNSQSASKLIDAKFKFRWSELSISHPECGNWHPNTIFVSEPGIYSLMFRSRSIFVKKFLYHITNTVLPAIRETGENPHVATSQANSLIETLRQTLSEKDRMLTETREALIARERALKEIQMTLANRENILAETREALEEVSTMLRNTRAALEERTRMLENEMQQKRQLQNDIQILRSKVSVSPKSKSVHYTLCVYQHENTYKFIRAQKRGLKKARARIPAEFKMVYLLDNAPNPFHIVNKLKELLPQCKTRFNTITTDANVIELLKQCV